MKTARAYRSTPPGIEMAQYFQGRRFGYNYYKGLVLVITFLCYAGYHASRKPPSVVKSVLKGDNSTITVNVDTVGWAPFNGHNGKTLLGEVDLAFLGAYAIGMFFAGHLGDRLDLRYFLTGGMLGSGMFVSLFGMAFFWKIHSFSYFVAVSIMAGLFQATGWPSVVSIMANWFGKGKRGLIMGVWNAHTSLGNILGTVIAAAALSNGWGWAFVLPGFIMILLGFMVFTFLVVQPSDVGLPSPYEQPKSPSEEDPKDAKHEAAEGIHFMDAWNIPGVSTYAFCLFFSKLIAYTFLYWLPYYINTTSIENRFLSPKEAGDLSTLFDVGGVMGGIMAGHLSDKTSSSAIVSMAFTLLSVPFLYLYRTYGHMSMAINVGLMMICGFFVNGPYALITTAVSADLGTHESLQGNAKALATVTAIIDGMGSVGAAVGPVMTGYISDLGGFNGVFVMLYVAAISAGVLLIKLAAKEWQILKEKPTKYIRVGSGSEAIDSPLRTAGYGGYGKE